MDAQQRERLRTECENWLSSQNLTAYRTPRAADFSEQFRQAIRREHEANSIPLPNDPSIAGGIAEQPNSLQANLERLQSEVEDGYRALNCPPPDAVYLDVIARGQLFGMVRKASESAGGYFILVDFGLLLATFQMFKVFAASWHLPVDSKSAWAGLTNYAWAPEKSKNALVEIAHAYWHECDTTKATQFPPLIGPNEAMLAAFVDYAERFVIAHEYAHIIRGDVDGFVSATALPKSFDNSAGISEAHKIELDADSLALSCVMETAKDPGPKTGKQFCLAAVVGWFAAVDFLYLAGARLGKHTMSQDSHPLNATRAVHLIDQGVRRWGDDCASNARSVASWWLAYANSSFS